MHVLIKALIYVSDVEPDESSLLSSHPQQQQNHVSNFLAPSSRYYSRPRSCALKVQVADRSPSIPHESYTASGYETSTYDTEVAIDTVLSTEKS